MLELTQWISQAKTTRLKVVFDMLCIYKPNSVPVYLTVSSDNYLSRPVVANKLKRLSPISPTTGGCEIECPPQADAQFFSCLWQEKLAHGLALR